MVDEITFITPTHNLDPAHKIDVHTSQRRKYRKDRPEVYQRIIADMAAGMPAEKTWMSFKKLFLDLVDEEGYIQYKHQLGNQCLMDCYPLYKR
jgi:hypothetical protein